MDLTSVTAETACRMRDLFCEFSFRALWAAICSALSWLVGGWGEAMTALVALYVLDFALGFGLAWRDSQLSATRFRGGLYKILLYGLVIAVANLLDLAVGDLPFLEHPIRALFILYLALGEFLSACAHISSLHPGILPAGLLVRVRNYRRSIFRPENCSEVHDAAQD
ncbi:MAG: phage holin family protein [Desulfovibrionaceae bacterium]